MATLPKRLLPQLIQGIVGVTAQVMRTNNQPDSFWSSRKFLGSMRIYMQLVRALIPQSIF